MSKQAVIYVVSGETGEYSDRSEWPVAAYAKEDDAKQHVVKATEYSKAWQVASQGMDYWKKHEALRTANPMDPNFSCDYTGTTYGYQEVKLHKSFKEVEVTN